MINTPVRLLQAVVSIIITVSSMSAFSATGNPRINQHSYLPSGPKVATYANSSTSPLAWKLMQNGTMVSSGNTTVFGADETSGEYVHQIDFSSFTAQGENYAIQIGSDTSYPFNIDATAYSAASYDAIRYFYHNRSGIEIETQYTGGGHGSYAADSKWSRPAGHVNGTNNPGDYNVPCWPGTCDYALDVPKGWYDAGDHGKYVVNGGISVWKLLNAYERALYLGSNSDAFADGMLNIPESGNGVPDLLDEARWQLEFLMAMQVPDGKPMAGMVHHKMHDENWTGFPLAPHEDTQNRYLVPPSTAATLNVAAVAAQCARIWKDIDSNFANKCLTVAQKAWDAAQNNPDVVYDGNYDSGGGAYGDEILADEFIWAAAELYITTGDNKYASRINTTLDSSEWGWENTQAAALLSLATVPTTSATTLGKEARNTIQTLSDELLKIANSEGYEIIANKYNFYWGSNNSFANKLILLASAYDYTGNEKYLTAFGKNIDYLFGRNALSKSYITGYGENAAAQPHHRFWSGVIDNSYPWAPPGTMVGGPNQSLDGPKAKALLDGCQSAAQTCYADNIQAYSVNEITINWNSAFFWITAFYDDYARSAVSSNTPPVAMLNVSATSGEAPFGITFDASGSSDADGDTLSYNWNFGDGSSGSGLTAYHSYTTAGNYTAVLTISDGRGGQTTESSYITITSPVISNTAPVANLNVNATSGEAPVSIAFDASGSSDADGDVLSYNWNFGDGSSGSGLSINHTYITAGNYTAVLTISDGNGGQTSESVSITITSAQSSNTPPVAKLNVSATSGEAPVSIAFDASGSSDADGDTLSYNWNFGDGSSGSGLSINHTYITAGNYTAVLSVSDGNGGQTSESVSITITSAQISNTPPVAKLNVSATSGEAPISIAFDASGSSDADGDTLSYNWNFGDGSSGSGLSINHTYITAGNYTAVLSVSDGNGGQTSESVSITITSAQSSNTPPVAKLNVSATSGEAPFSIAFDASGSTDADGDTLSYNWNFGDGSSGSGLTANHSYTTAGNYTAILTVTDSNGGQTTESIAITITQASNESSGDSDNDSGSDDGSKSAGSFGSSDVLLLTGLIFFRRKLGLKKVN